ncbi:MAG: hypothetical protein RLZZ298_3073 [Pseudomonadota bacterium]
MTIFFQKLFAMLLLAISISYALPWLLSNLPHEPAGEAPLLCGLVIGALIARQRLNAERFLP